MRSPDSAERFYVYGAGGHGKVVAEALALRYGAGAVLGFLDDAPPAPRVLSWPVLRPQDLPGEAWRSACLIMAIGDNGTRAEVAERLAAQGVRFGRAVHPAAAVSPSARLGEGVMICAAAVINAEAALGDHAIVNSGAILEHDCALGVCAHLAPGAVLGGGVQVGPRTLIGLGASVLPGLRIGAGCLIGAGAVVIRDVADGERVAGNPAKPLP